MGLRTGTKDPYGDTPPYSEADSGNGCHRTLEGRPSKRSFSVCQSAASALGEMADGLSTVRPVARA